MLGRWTPEDRLQQSFSRSRVHPTNDRGTALASGEHVRDHEARPMTPAPTCEADHRSRDHDDTDVSHASP